MELNKDDQTKIDTVAGTISYAIILTPDCDLLQDYIAQRDGGTTVIFGVLMFGAEESSRAKERVRYNSREWNHAVQNEMERFHFLKEIKSDEDLLTRGLPDLVVDFKRYFTL